MFAQRMKIWLSAFAVVMAMLLACLPAKSEFGGPTGILFIPRDVTEADGDGHRKRQVKDSKKKKEGREKQGKQEKVERKTDSDSGSDSEGSESKYQTKEKQTKKRGRRDRRIAEQEEKEELLLEAPIQ